MVHDQKGNEAYIWLNITSRFCLLILYQMGTGRAIKMLFISLNGKYDFHLYKQTEICTYMCVWLTKCRMFCPNKIDYFLWEMNPNMQWQTHDWFRYNSLENIDETRDGIVKIHFWWPAAFDGRCMVDIWHFICEMWQ